MAKRKVKKNSKNLLKKGITLVSSILVAVFLFLETLVFKGKGNVLGINFSSSDNPETVSVFKFLFNGDYEPLREELNTTVVVLWVVVVAVVVAVAASVLSLLVAKKGNLLAKVGGSLLAVAMLVLFIVNLDKYIIDAGFLGSGELYLSNLTVLYFVSLAASLLGLGSSLSLKK